MKLYFFGTCAGIEPVSGRKHSAMAVETEGKVYWIDAGEGCSRTAYLMGIDFPAIRKILISHTHFDHVSGLSNLIYYIGNLAAKQGKKVNTELYIPDRDTLEGAAKVLGYTGTEELEQDGWSFHGVADGILCDEDGVRISAVHNRHFCKDDGRWHSFSYLLEAEGKKVVCSGDLADYGELDGLVSDGCDALVIETSHFGIEAAYEYTSRKNPGQIFLTHSGREIVRNPQEARQRVKQLFGEKTILCEDAMTVEI